MSPTELGWLTVAAVMLKVRASDRRKVICAGGAAVLIPFRARLAVGKGSVKTWDDGHGMSAETLHAS